LLKFWNMLDTSASPQRTVYVLGKDGVLYCRPEAAFVAKDNTPWQRVADLGPYHTSIAVDCGYIYAVNEELGVDFQCVKGANRGRWAFLAAGYVVDVASTSGTIYGCGRGVAGDPVYKHHRGGGSYPWDACSGGKVRSISVDPCGKNIFGIGADDWVYTQPLAEMTCHSRWAKTYRAGGVIISFAILGEGEALGVRQDQLWYLRDGHLNGEWALEESAPSLGVGLLSVSVSDGEVPCSTTEVQRRIPASVSKPIIAQASAVAEKPAVKCEEKVPSRTDLKNDCSDSLSVCKSDAQQKVESNPTPLTSAPPDEVTSQTRSAPRAVESLAPERGARCKQSVQSERYSKVVGKCNITAVSRGYLDIDVGNVIEVLHVGAENSDERGWLYGRALESSREGWIARSAVDPERRTPLFVKTAKQAMVSPLQGYLGVTNGDPVEVLYLGDQGDEQGWIYGRVLSTLREGWLPRSVVFDEAVEPLD